MKTRPLLAALTLSGCCMLSLFTSCKRDDNDDTPPPPVTNAYAIGSSNNLLLFNLASSSTITSKTITGIEPGESILGIDIRPANNKLYALGSTSRLYIINTSTGQATAVNATPFTATLKGVAFGFDFTSVADRLRIVSNLGQNIRIHPETGVTVSTDIDITPAGVGVSAIAYTNNAQGATNTVLYDIDPVTDKLYKQENPNAGGLVTVGALGINVDASNGFDISGKDNKAYALLTSGGVTKLYSINLVTGAATPIGDFPSAVKGLAVALNL